MTTMAGSLICMKPGAPASPLFLVPSAATKPLSLIHLTRSIDTPRTIYSFVFDGIENDQAPHMSIEDMAAAFVVDIRGVQPHGPYVVGGHCFGGIVAFEIVARLEALGEQVALLMLLNTFSPLAKTSSSRADNALHKTGGSTQDAELHVKQALELVYEQSSKQLARLPLPEAQRYERILRIQIDAALRHRGVPVDAEIVQFRTRTHDDAVFLDWRTFAPGGYRELEVAGDTFSMLSPPHVRELCRQLGELLSEH